MLRFKTGRKVSHFKARTAYPTPKVLCLKKIKLILNIFKRHQCHKVYKYAVGNKYIDPYFEPRLYSKLVGELSLDGCWGFFGDSDQGRYTFNVMHGKKYYGVLEPLEWK